MYYVDYEQDHLVRDIDQTDLHRFEPSSRTLLMDEHSYLNLNTDF